MATKETTRTRMSEEQVNAYLKHYAKGHDLKGKEFDHAVKHCAATRWAALERWSKAHPAKAKAKRAKAKKGPHKKAA